MVGAQWQLWQREAIGADTTLARRQEWVADVEANKCEPRNPEYTRTADVLEDIKGTSCEGGNNCFSRDYTMKITILWGVCMLANHFFMAIVLNGACATRVRKSIR